MSPRVGVLFGMERTFPHALCAEIVRRSEGRVEAEPLSAGALRIDKPLGYDLVLDRISHEVPFYRTLLKQAVFQGAQVVNNPFWFSADDKYFGCLAAERAGVAVPRTVLLPHKRHPPGTSGSSFSNLRYPLDWDEVFSYLGFPLFLKPAYGGGWKDVSRCADPQEFFQAYDASRDLCMMAQEEIVFSEYFRCYVLGRERVRLMRYDPGRPFHERYVRSALPLDPALEARLTRDCLALCEALGYDFNTVELAVREGVPYAIDFTNPCPDCEPSSVGEENFAWVLDASAAVLLERLQHPRPFELSGTWTEGRR